MNTRHVLSSARDSELPACRSPLPLLTAQLQSDLQRAAREGAASIQCSVDLGRTRTIATAHRDHWEWQGRRYPYLESCKERTIYFWGQDGFQPIARYRTSLIKLVPTPWGAPTFEIDGIKMLPTAQVSPFEDAARKVDLIRPRGRKVLDTCGGLGYFAVWCLRGGARAVRSYELNPDVLWLRELNPWSPEGGGEADGRLTLEHGDVTQKIAELADDEFDAVLHDPPRFGIAGELYSLAFYGELARVLKTGGRLFHYTGAPNRLASGRNLAKEVEARLRRAGFSTRPVLDGVFAVKERAGRA
jgi:predicted methyltransferase